MAQYQVQDPTGQLRVIEGPDGASDAEVIAQAQKLFGMSGGMTQKSGLDTIREYINNNRLQKPNPNSGFEQDIQYLNDPNATASPTGQRLLENANVAAAGYGVGALGATLANGAINKAGQLMQYLKGIKSAPAAAEALAPAESAAEAGNIIQSSRVAEQTANKATAKALYDKLPQDLKLPTPSVQSTADSVINEIKTLPKSFQSSKISSLAADLQNIDQANLGTLQTMQSTLKDMARNGDGIEKLYAARLSKAISSDIEAFSNSSVLPPISQGKSLEAEALRNMWGHNAIEQSGASTDIVAPYVKPEVFQPSIPKSAYTNSDVSENLKRATSYYRDMKDLDTSPLAKALDRASLESKAKIIFRKGQMGDVLGAKALLGDEGYAAASGQFYHELLNSKDLGKALSKYSSEFLQTALGQDRVNALMKLAEFHQALAKAKLAAKVAGATTATTTAGVGLYKLFH